MVQKSADITCFPIPHVYVYANNMLFMIGMKEWQNLEALHSHVGATTTTKQYK